MALVGDMKYLTIGDATYEIPSGGDPYTGTIQPVSTVANSGSSTAFARGDHVHNIASTAITGALGYTPVSTSVTINNKPLSGNITLAATDVGALPDSTTIPSSVSQLNNDSGYITSSDLPSLATTSANGLMSSTDKTKLDGFNPSSCYSLLQNLVDGSATGSLRHINASTFIEKYATAIGYNSTASSTYAFAEGYATIASGEGSHAEGSASTASGTNSHAEGYQAKASGNHSHAEGRASTASALYSHAQGEYTLSSGQASHVEGWASTASALVSHAEGYYTTAASTYQHVEGKYNIQDSSGTYIHIAGNGTANNARSNAYTLDWDGNGIYAGKLTVGSTGSNSMDVATIGQLAESGAKITTTSITIPSSGWDTNQSYTATGLTDVTSTNTIIATYAPSSKSAYTTADVYCSAQATESLTFYCINLPSVDIDVNLMIIN